MTLYQGIEVFATLTGVAYILLEILQKNAMWLVGIATGIACAWSFGAQQLWASMGLNIYYVIMSVIGLAQWRKASESVEGIHLRKLTRPVATGSALAFVLGSLLLIALLRFLQDAEPVLDGISFGLSIIATLWLARSYPEQWLLWIVADLLSTGLCLVSGLWMMSGLYLLYTASAVYGYFHWMHKGSYIE